MIPKPSLPVAAGRIICMVGLSLCILLTVVLLLGAGALAAGWPALMVSAVEQGASASLAGLQPWVSLVLAFAAIMVALAAQLFRTLLALLDSVARGDAFEARNNRRLKQVGWLMLAMQGMGFLTGLAGRPIADQYDLAAGFDFSVSGLLAALLAFVLADVFDQARRLRDDLEGTV